MTKEEREQKIQKKKSLLSIPLRRARKPALQLAN